MAFLLSALILTGVYTINAGSIGKLLDKKLNEIDMDIRAFKMLHGSCAPCRVVRTPKRFCDCRNLKTKEDCLEYYQSGMRINGIYKLPGPKFNTLHVFCDQTSNGGGWTVIQRRVDGKEKFDRNWDEYKQGFGDLKHEFWLGNDKIHRLTSNQPYGSSLFISMKLTNHSSPVWVKYGNFSVGNESTQYTLHVDGFTGNTLDQMTYHNNVKFSTFDQDNDDRDSNCAERFRAGWWYKSCYRANLNGLYRFGSNCKYINWGGGNCSIQARFSEMMIRRNV